MKVSMFLKGRLRVMRCRLSSNSQRSLRTLCIFGVALSVTYFLSKLINIGYGPFVPDIPWDHHIPFVPMFVLIYFGSYIYWVAGVWHVGSRGREALYELLTAAILSFGVCLLFFVFLPTTIVRPEITESGVFNELMRLLYRLDTPQNLFPSMHCMNSWLIFIAVRGRKEYSKWVRIFFCVFSLFVFASTVFVKQHFLIDIVAGVLLAEIMTLVVRKLHVDVCFGKFLDKTIMRGL